MISLTYAITREDYADYFTYVMWDSPEKASKRRRYYIKQLIPPLLFLVAFYFTGLFNRTDSFILIIAGFLLLTMALSLMGVRTNLKKQSGTIYNDQGNSSMFEEKTIHMSESGILIQEAYVESKLQWKSFIKKMETDQHFYLFTSSVHALIIPKRVFNGEQQILQFKKLLSQYLSFDAELGHLVKS